MYDEGEIIGGEFLTELLDMLDSMDLKANTKAEHQLIYELIKTLKDTIEFTND